MEKKDVKVFLLIVFVIIAVSLSCFIVYDKFLKKETCNCSKTDCKEECEKDNDKNNCIESEFDSDFLPTTLYGKYVNVTDKKSIISFDNDSTWRLNRNSCEGYQDVSGTYYFDGEKYVLISPDFYDDEMNFRIVSADTYHDIVLLFDESRMIAGCSGSSYYILEK